MRDVKVDAISRLRSVYCMWVRSRAFGGFERKRTMEMINSGSMHGFYASGNNENARNTSVSLPQHASLVGPVGENGNAFDDESLAAFYDTLADAVVQDAASENDVEMVESDSTSEEGDNGTSVTNLTDSSDGEDSAGNGIAANPLQPPGVNPAGGEVTYS